MKHEVIPDTLWEAIRSDFITSQAGPYELGKKYNVRGHVIKQRALTEHWRKLRAQWQEQHILPDTVRAEPILTTNIAEPIVRDFFFHYYRQYINMLPRLSADAERLSDLIGQNSNADELLQLVTARERVLERTRVILGVMAPGQIKDIPKNRKTKLPPPVPSSTALAPLAPLIAVQPPVESVESVESEPEHNGE